MNEIKLLFRNNIEPVIQELKDKGVKIYSISRINNYHQCPLQYYYTYINKKSAKTGVYGFLGTACHSDLEDLYTNKTKKITPINFNDSWNKAELFNINFPISKGDIKGNYKSDIDSFYKYYKKREGEFICELGFILKLDEWHCLLGYIDLIQLLGNGYVNIFDFKTSAQFKGDKTFKAGRQLCVYEMALEQLYGLKTRINAWEMLKYLEITIDGTKKIVSARKWVEECKTLLKKLMVSEDIEKSFIEMYLNACINNNNIDILPIEIKNKIDINIFTETYSTNESIKEETLDYINTTIKEIESKSDNINDWIPKSDDFFCRNLCSFSFDYCNSFNKY